MRHEKTYTCKEAVAGAILTDARTKVVFGGLTPEEAETMAEFLYMGEFDLEEAKTSLDKPVVVGHDLRWFENESTTTTRGESETRGTAATRGTSTTTTRTRGTSKTDGWSDAPGRGGFDIPPSISRSWSAGTSAGRSVATGASASETASVSRTTSESRGETTGRSEGLVPLLELLPTAVFSLDDQRHKKAAFLRNLRRQEAVVKVPDRPSAAFRTVRVETGYARSERVEQFKQASFLRSPFAKPSKAVDALLRVRRASLERSARATDAPATPDDFLE